MKKFAFSAALAAVLGIAAFSLADAQGGGQPGSGRPGGPGFGRGPGGGGPMSVMRHVDLTEAQREQINTILEQEREGRQGPAAGEDLHRQLRAEILADQPDDQKIETLRMRIAQAHTSGLVRQIEIEKKIAQVLTPEQRVKARTELAKAPEERGRRGGADRGSAR